MKKPVVVIIPIHQDEPSELEKISLRQTLSVLHKHLITFQTKEGISTKWYEDFCRGKTDVSFERFKWNGFNEYTDLVMSPEFYLRFKEYEYMLICHLDAFVFRDELDKWCASGYDYIGSVIYNNRWDNLPTRLGKLIGFVRPEYFSNGGFGLRRIEAFLYITRSWYVKSKMFLWKLRHTFFQDDIFIAQIIPKLDPKKFKLPPKSIAQKFGAAFEHFDENNLPFNNVNDEVLPVGIHGWWNYNLDFWKPCLERYGYKVNDA